MFSSCPKNSRLLLGLLLHLTFCGLTNGPSKSPFNCFCFKRLTQLWAVLWRKPVHSRSHKRYIRYATEIQCPEKHSNCMLWWLFGYVHLQLYKDDIWSSKPSELHGFLATLVNPPVDVLTWVLQLGTILTLIFKLFGKITKGIFIYLTTYLLILPNWQ